MIEEHNSFERLQVDGDSFCEVGVGLCEVRLGQGNLCCNWADLVHKKITTQINMLNTPLKMNDLHYVFLSLFQNNLMRDVYRIIIRSCY